MKTEASAALLRVLFWTAVVASPALLVSCYRTPPVPQPNAQPALRLDARLQADDGIVATVTGRAGMQVAVVANRPWRSDEEVYAGPLGARWVAIASDAEQATGAGTQFQGVLSDAPLVVPIAAARLAALPAPVMIQVLAWDSRAGKPEALLSNAWRWQRTGGRAELVPATAGHRLGDALGSMLWFVLLPLTVVALVRFGVRWRAGPRWLLPLLALGAVAIRVADGRVPWLSTDWPRDELAVLERHYGAGVQQIVAALREGRRSDDSVAVLLDARRVSQQQSLAAQLARLVPADSVTSDPAALPARGLVVVLGDQTLPAGQAMVATPIGAVVRVGGG